MSKHILITGASRGMGYEAALHLARQGHHVIAVARSEERLEKLSQKASTLTAHPADLTDSNDIDRLVDALTDDQILLDALVNGAGALVNKPFDQLTTDDWDRMLQVNVMAPVQLIQKTMDRLAEGSHIVNISSMAGYQGSAKFPGLAAYSVAKGGLSILTECLAAEFSDQSITCNALCLGMVQTEMLEEAFPGVEAPVSASRMGKYIADFAIEGHTYYSGQILPVARQDPE